MVDSRDICDFIARLGTPLTPPLAWKRFKFAGPFFQLKMAPLELMRQLKTNFDLQDLLEARAVTMAPEGPVLSPWLAKTGTFIALGTGPDSSPIDLLGPNGKTLSGRWGLVAVLDDRRMRALLERREEQLLIVPSLVDAAVLQSFGFPAIPVAGLSGLNGQTAEVLAKELRLQRHRRTVEAVPAGLSPPEFEESESRDLSIAVVVANWSPAGLDRSDVPTILTLWKYFQEIDKYFGIDMQEFSIWKPTDADLERLRFCSERGSKRHVEQALLDSLIVSCESLDMSELKPPIPQTLAEAVAAWAAFPDDSVSARFKSRAWKWVVNLLDQELIEPLRQQAREETDPTKRNRLMIVAQLSAMLHPLLARLTTGLAKSDGANRGGVPGGFPRGEFQQARAMLNQIDSLTKELHTCPPKRKAKPASRAKPSKTARSLPNSDSVLPNSPR